MFRHVHTVNSDVIYVVPLHFTRLSAHRTQVSIDAGSSRLLVNLSAYPYDATVAWSERLTGISVVSIVKDLSLTFWSSLAACSLGLGFDLIL